MAKDFLECTEGTRIDLPAHGALPAAVHVFDAESVHAINAALAAERPLLVRGEPGTGKSQLARAAAVALKWGYRSKVIDARTEVQDLFFTFDAVARLAEAQLQGALRSASSKSSAERLDEQNFLAPGPLWWGFDWASADQQARRVGAHRPPSPNDATAARAVVLLDEIDKADSSVPNGLLEALGNGEFTVPGRGGKPIRLERERAPLVVVTTNEERSLPDAFLRRCLVLQIRLAESPAELVEWLVKRGKAHFPAMTEPILREAAELLVKEREVIKKRQLCPPGQAEYLDLVRVLERLAATKRGDRAKAQRKLLNDVKRFALRKHPDEVAV